MRAVVTTNSLLNLGSSADEYKKRAGSKPCPRRLALVPEFIALVPEAQLEISQPHRGW
jgi:hypothetical protein